MSYAFSLFDRERIFRQGDLYVALKKHASLSLSKHDRKMAERFRIISEVKTSLLTQEQAAEMLGVTERQVRRLLVRLDQEGIEGLRDKSVGQSGHHRYPDVVKAHVLDLATESYPDAGPTLLSDLLKEEHGIVVSSETLRHWLNDAEIIAIKTSGSKHRRRRDRRTCYGELVQVDTSCHHWFGKERPKAYLIAMIDDATSKLHAKFHDSDSTVANMATIKEYIEKFGRPVALYTDKASHFKVNKGETSEDVISEANPAETQIKRALDECDITLITAHSPQAKGRVERLFGTLQDRLLKRMKFSDITNIADANKFLENAYCAMWNARYGVEPISAYNAHRSKVDHDLKAIFSVHYRRTAYNDYTFRLHNKHYQIEPGNALSGLKRSKVLIERRLDGSVHAKHDGRYLVIHEIAKKISD
jgi:transposase